MGYALRIKCDNYVGITGKSKFGEKLGLSERQRLANFSSAGLARGDRDQKTITASEEKVNAGTRDFL